MEHTKGPWEVDELKSGNLFIQGNSRDYTVAQVLKNHYVDDEIHKANAKLIAASPDMLEALEGMLQAYEGDAGDTDSPACIKARAAIEQARS